MSTTNPRRQERAGTDRRFTPRHVYLGVDAEGYHHHADRDAHAVYRFDADGIERVTDLDVYPDQYGDTALEAYIHEHVATDVGWDARPYVTTCDLGGMC